MGLFNNRKKLTQSAVVATNSQVSSNINPAQTNTTNYFLDSNSTCNKCTKSINEKSNM